ncbi:hypothetical protein [Kitasatospora aureofaciens]|uniref:hypothetical protein n=1 Tax=Kitasatospora aureofaciens TaxID=1894 RepID=UPI0037C75F90
MVLLARFDTFGLGADFEPATGELGPERAIGPGQATHGHYGELAGTGVVFYRDTDGLHVRVGERECRVDAATAVRHWVRESECVLAIGQFAELRYPAPSEWSDLEKDMTPFIDAEDFDLGLFIANVARDRDRAERIYR